MQPEIEALLLQSLIDHRAKYKWMCYGEPTLVNLVNSLSAEYVDLHESVSELQDELSKAADMAVLAYDFVNGTVTLDTLTNKLDDHFNPIDDDGVAAYYADMSAIDAQDQAKTGVMMAQDYINSMKSANVTVELSQDNVDAIADYVKQNPTSDVKIIKTPPDSPDVLVLGKDKPEKE